MKPQTKIALRRFAIRQLIKLVDRVEEWLHEAQVRLREKLAAPASIGGPIKRAREGFDSLQPAQSAFQKWEARRSGVAVISKKEARRRRATSAADFDRRFVHVE